MNQPKKRSLLRRIIFAILGTAVICFVVLYLEASQRAKPARIGLMHLYHASKNMEPPVGGNFRNLYYGTADDGSQNLRLNKRIADARWKETHREFPTVTDHEEPSPCKPYHGYYFMEDPDYPGAFFAIPADPRLFDMCYWTQGTFRLFQRPAFFLNLSPGDFLKLLSSPHHDSKWRNKSYTIEDSIEGIPLDMEVQFYKARKGIDMITQDLENRLKEIKSQNSLGN